MEVFSQFGVPQHSGADFHDVAKIFEAGEKSGLGFGHLLRCFCAGSLLLTHAEGWESQGARVDGFALAAAVFAAIICCKAAWGHSVSGSKAFKSLLVTLWAAEIAWAFVTVP